MGRRSSRPSPPRRAPAPAPRRSASSRASPPSPAKRPAAPPAPAPAAAAPPAPAPAQGGSAMGGFMANVAATATGVALGRGLDRALFGGGSGGAAPPAEHEEQEHAAYAQDGVANGSHEQIPESVCFREVSEFKKCLDRSGHQIAECQWNLDILTQCQNQAAQNAGFAEAPRL